MVFTLPHAFGPLVLQNRRRLYGILFRATAQTLLTIGRDPKHLGAEIGFLALLHTWGQRLQLHPHIHCVVPGGGLAPHGDRWIPCRSKKFFLPVRVLSRLFRAKVLGLLRRAHRQGQLCLQGSLAPLEDPATWSIWLDTLATKEWVVYAKPPFGGPGQVLKYLARYTHRVAISNARLVAIDDGEVTFRWKDYAHGNQQRLMRLDAQEFIRRFLLHLLPPGFMRIRHYGYLANRVRVQRLTQIRSLMSKPKGRYNSAEVAQAGHGSRRDAWLCPVCEVGHLVRIERVPPQTSRARPPPLLAA